MFGLQRKDSVTFVRDNPLNCLDRALSILAMLIPCMAVTYFQILGTLVTLNLWNQRKTHHFLTALAANQLSHESHVLVSQIQTNNSTLIYSHTRARYLSTSKRLWLCSYSKEFTSRRNIKLKSTKTGDKVTTFNPDRPAHFRDFKLWQHFWTHWQRTR